MDAYDFKLVGRFLKLRVGGFVLDSYMRRLVGEVKNFA